MGGRGSKLIEKHIKGNDNRQSDIILLNDPETEYKNDMFKKLKQLEISTRKSTDDIDDIVLKRQQEQFYNIAVKYKRILQNTTQKHEMQLQADKLTGGTLAYCAFNLSEKSQSIVLDKNQLKDYDKIVDTVKRAVKAGHFVPINTTFKCRDYIITHENGHAIENGIIVKLSKTKELNSENIKKFQSKIKSEVFDIYLKKYKTGAEDDKIYLSKYSSVNDAEWFAETFTNLELSDKPAPIAQALGEYIRRFNK